jgi:hypothetical protein
MVRGLWSRTWAATARLSAWSGEQPISPASVSDVPLSLAGVDFGSSW